MRKQKKRKGFTLEAAALNSTDLAKLAKHMKIPHFRGVFSRNELPKTIKFHERGIVNLNESHEPGSHWVAYVKNGDEPTHFFDPFGDLPPPAELMDYLGGKEIVYNTGRYQDFGEVICGHLCLFALKQFPSF